MWGIKEEKKKKNKKEKDKKGKKTREVERRAGAKTKKRVVCI
jgi:hypothetical protein